MGSILCGLSAFRIHRTPPQILMLCPPLPDLDRAFSRSKLLEHPVAQEILELPVHALVTNPASRRNSRLIKTHLWSSSIPTEGIRDSIVNTEITSPLFTLLTLAPSISEIHLAMAMYEFCGTFGVFRPTNILEQELRRAYREGALPANYGWERVHDAAGNPTGLWKRPPLVELHELREFAELHRGARGGNKFLAAAHMVTGMAASPFEAQLSILLGLPKKKGGKALAGFTNNAEIRLTREARLVYPHTRCYGDIFWDSTDKHGALDIECQSEMVHNSTKSAISDSDRTTALASMGIDVLPITYSQITSIASFDAVCNLIRKKLAIRPRGKTAAEIKREKELRQELFIDWTTLGI